MAKGLWFRNVDLHVHTPASDCFLDKSITPEAIVQQAIAVGMDAIAITDHNSAAGVDGVMAAAVGTSLTVFPGVEIAVAPGVHVLAIFPETRRGEHITDLLSEVGINADSRGNPEALVTRYGIPEVLAIIEQHGALPILAHIDAPKGVWNELRNSGQTIVQLWNSRKFVTVEIVGDDLPTELTNDPFEYRPAFYWSSDNPDPANPIKHSEMGIGTRFSRFKLETPITWIGLLHCFQDPDVRIRHGSMQEIAINHPMVRKVTIQNGFLDGLDLELTPNLNAVIGGRGTGKSSLLEILRYAFDIEAKSDANREQSERILGYVFPARAQVGVEFCLADGCHYRVERRGQEPPKVYRTGEDQPVDVPPGELLPLQMYGQKEIYEISKRPDFQLRLLDNYIAEGLNSLEVEEKEILRQMSDNAVAILRLEEDIESAQDWLSRLGGIQEELRRMENRGFVDRVKRKQLYDQEYRLINQARSQVEELQNALIQFAGQHRLNTSALESTPDNLPNRDFLLQIAQTIQQIQRDLDARFEAMNKAVAKEWQKTVAGWQSWQSAYQAEEMAHQELLREFQGAEDADRYLQLQSRKAELEERQRQVSIQQTQVQHLRRSRRVLLDRLRTVRRRKYELRRAKASELSQKLRGMVRVTVYPQGYREPFKEYLQELFSGLNVRNPHRDHLADAEAAQPERKASRPIQDQGRTVHLVARIPCYLDPIDLAEAIRNEQSRADEDSSTLETAFGIDSDGMRRNMAGLSPSQLFDLEAYEVPDLPVVELQASKGELGFRKLDELSVGQKCTALLSLVLLESPAPLVIDQPEDDLDNQFIFDQIVATLRSEKERRQFIIATHNANIPVSGDAELIIVLQSNQRKGWVDADGIGSIDREPIKQSVEKILEGGETAFKIRKEKYGIH
jgi:ABC-type lipoprotein export system ATPase subunit